MEEKRKAPQFTVDFVTALPVEECIQRLERSSELQNRGVGAWLAPIEQQVILSEPRTFTVERRFPGAIQPLQLVGQIDPDPERRGTWVHGAVIRDAANQVLIEGMLLFLGFFLISVLFYLRLRTRGFMISLPIFLLLLIVLSLRWRAIRRATEDMARWVRRKLYVTPNQLR